MQTLEQLADVDMDQESLIDVLLPSSLSSLRSAVSQLGLQLWLKEGGLEELLPRLMESGHTSKRSLQALDPSAAAKVKIIAATVICTDHTSATVVCTDHTSATVVCTDHTSATVICTDHTSATVVCTNHTSATVVCTDHTSATVICTDHTSATVVYTV